MSRWTDQQGQYLFLVAMFAFLLVTGSLKSFQPRLVAMFLTGMLLLGLALFTDMEWLLVPALPLVVVPVFLDMRDEWRRARDTPPPGQHDQFRDFPRTPRQFWQDSPPPRHAKYPPNQDSRVGRGDLPPGNNRRRPPDA